jgi:hypothetical protein
MAPVATFLAARSVVFAASWHAGTGWPGSRDLSRADSFNYLSIASHGYILHRCPPACVPGVGLPWSGNSGWFPLYPLLIAPFSHVGLASTAGIVLAAVFQFAAISVLWFGFLIALPKSRSLPLLALTAVFPGSIYYAAIFPMSLFALLLLSGLVFIGRRNVGAVSVIAFLAAATHPSGWAFAACAAWSFRSRLTSALLPCVSAAAAVASMVVAQWLMTGHWNAYSLSEKGRGLGINDPLNPLRFAKSVTLSFVKAPSFFTDPSRQVLVQYIQTILVLFVVVAALGAVAARLAFGRSRLNAQDSAGAVLVSLLWVAPLVLGGVSLYRLDSALLPSIILLRYLPRFGALPLVLAAAPVAFLMDVVFFRGLLVTGLIESSRMRMRRGV